MTELKTSVTVSRRIEAPPETIFAVLAEPARHLDMDGSGMLRGTSFAGLITGPGDVFVMAMHYGPIGDYEMDNRVVAFEESRRIGWAPEAGAGHPDHGTDRACWGHTWTFDLQPDRAGTLVSETWDCSAADVPEDGEHWIPSMSSTLQRLDDLCRQAPAG